jgi:hypothetical protein
MKRLGVNGAVRRIYIYMSLGVKGLSGKPSVLAVLTHGKKPRYPMNRRLGGSGCSARAWNRYQERPARSLVPKLATSARVVACTYFRIITRKD